MTEYMTIAAASSLSDSQTDVTNGESYIPSTDWKIIDRELTRLAARRAGHDYEEGRWLVAGRRAAVHQQLGFATFSEYVERKLGYDPRTTAERLRVATALELLPLTRDVLRNGKRSWSAVRELSRILVPETETEWLEATANETVRQIEERVLGRRPGDRPSEPKRPELRRRRLRYDLGPETFALYRDDAELIRMEVDPQLSEEAVLAEMCRRVLGGPTDEGRAPYQVQLTRCDTCARTWQDARGEQIEVDPEVGERAACDEQVISAGAHVGASEPRARQSVTPALRRKIMRRDSGRCRVPGCSNTRWLEIHHLHLQSEGGPHLTSNLAALCGTHHTMQHRGQLLIEGDADGDCNLVFKHADGTHYGERVRPETIEAHRDAFLGLRNLGFGETQSHALVEQASAHVGAGASAETLLMAAIKSAHGVRKQDGPSRVREAGFVYGGILFDFGNTASLVKEHVSHLRPRGRIWRSTVRHASAKPGLSAGSAGQPYGSLAEDVLLQREPSPPQMPRRQRNHDDSLLRFRKEGPPKDKATARA